MGELNIQATGWKEYFITWSDGQQWYSTKDEGQTWECLKPGYDITDYSLFTGNVEGEGDEDTVWVQEGFVPFIATSVRLTHGCVASGEYTGGRFGIEVYDPKGLVCNGGHPWC